MKSSAPGYQSTNDVAESIASHREMPPQRGSQPPPQDAKLHVMHVKRIGEDAFRSSFRVPL